MVRIEARALAIAGFFELQFLSMIELCSMAVAKESSALL